MTYLHKEIGISEPNVLYILIQIVCFILCLVSSHIHNPTARKYFSSISGLFLGFAFSGAGYFFILAHWLGVYLIV